MVAARAPEVERVLSRLDPGIAALLFYGPDAGLISERAKLAAQAAGEGGPADLVRLDGETIVADPGRLVDEVASPNLFGSPRTILVRPGNRSINPALELLFQCAPQPTRVIIEGGDLGKAAPLRVLCERSPRALALPCYADDDRSIVGLASEMIRAAGLSIEREAENALVTSLGGDRLATRAEVTKLILYAQGASKITLDDIDASVSDVAAQALDSVTDAAFSGELTLVDLGLRRLFQDGVDASTILMMTLRHALALYAHRIELDRGRSPKAVIEGLHFRRRTAVERHLSLWSIEALATQASRLQDAVRDVRRAPDTAEAQAAVALVALTREARLMRRRVA